jgi:hypothetical protein
MPRLSTQLWLAAVGEDWSFISAQTGITKLALAQANAGFGFTYNGSAFNKQPATNQVVFIPLASP